MKVKINLLIILLTSFIFCQCQTSSKKVENDELPVEVSTTIEKRIAEGTTPSFAIAIINQDGIKYYNFGKTSEEGKEVDEHTIYEIGSITKVFTAILLAQQVLEGDLKLDNKINDYLPTDVKVKVMGEEEITFGNLTDHTSGLPRMPDNFTPANPNNPYADYTVDQMYEFISNYQPVRKVGVGYEYSNLAQGLLGHLLAKNRNMTYENLMIQNIAHPLGMKETKVEFDQRMRDNLALGHSGGQAVENWDIPTLAGAGAIRSSTSDMAKFISANLGYLESSLMAAMQFSHKIRHNKAGEMRVAMGWHIKKGKNGDIFWHNGGTGGYRTFAGFVKETGRGVVLFTNSSTGADDIGFYLLDPASKLTEVKTKSDAIELPESSLDQFVGIYELKPEFKITITKEGSQLFGQATGQQRFEIYPKSDTAFFLTIVEAEISFQVNESAVESLTLFQAGQELVMKKTE